MNSFHTPVLLDEAIHYLNVVSGEKYIDATLGGGGHAQKIKSKGGLVLGLDQDEEAIKNSEHFVDCVVKTNFIHLEEVAKKQNWYPVAGVLFDLGTSMYQITESKRGFSFQKDGPLDMRMDLSTSLRADDVVNQLSVNQLISIFKDYGEIPVAKSLAEKIVNSRPFETTGQLTSVCGKWSRQAFQAIRIAVNDELSSIDQTLPQALRILKTGGRAVVISFHSLEDRIVKNTFNSWSDQKLGNILTKKPIQGERHSKLRAFEKI